MLLNARNIRKSYAGKPVLHQIDLQLEKGQILGLLGENGAGKSTTMQIISGCLSADNGDVTLDGIDLLNEPEKYKQQLGFLPEIPPLYKEMRVQDYLYFTAKLRQIPSDKIHDYTDLAISRCSLQKVCRKRIKYLSKGYQQRVGIAQAIIHQPKLIILDEPTVGLDPIQLEETRKLIIDLAQNSSVILSTHILQEVEACCDTVVLIKEGNIALTDKLSNIDSLKNVFSDLQC